MAQIDKTVSPTGHSARPAATLHLPAEAQLSRADAAQRRPLLRRAAGQHDLRRAASRTRAATFGAYTPIAAVQGADTGPDPQTTMDLTYSAASPFTQVLGSTHHRHDGAREQQCEHRAASRTLPHRSRRATACRPAFRCRRSRWRRSPTTNTTVNLTFTCTIASYGEISWDGDASGTFNGQPLTISRPRRRPRVLGVSTTTGTQVVKWIGMTTDRNTAPVPSVSFAPERRPALFAFEGGTAIWERYDVQPIRG